jgi:hypothetical protein
MIVVLLTVTFAAGQTTRYKAPRSPYGDGTPNLDGIWQAVNTAYWDIQDHPAQPAPIVAMGAWGAIPGGFGVVDGNVIPYRPDALARRKQNFDKRMTLDPEIKCYLPGVPRAMYLPYPFQIVQTPTDILMIFEYAGALRNIHMRQVPDSPIDTWMGQSRGRWEGDTLVIDSRSFNDRTWFDRAGNFHSEDLHVVERLTPTSADALQYEATIEDPKVFTRPWTMRMPLYRRLEPKLQLVELKCVEFVEEFLYGHLQKQIR